MQNASEQPDFSHTSAEIPWRAGYYPTLWPSEHTDLWRSHTVFDAGLPAQFDAAQLQVKSANLNLPVWGYTRAENQVFVIGGSPFMLEIFTTQIKGGPLLDDGKQATAAGFAIEQAQANVPYVARIDTVTMQVTQFAMNEGKTLNYTGGLLMHANGFVYAVAQSVLYKIDANTMQAVQSRQLPVVGDDVEGHFFTTYNGMQVLANGQLVLKGFHFFENASVPGWLLLINPDTLAFDVKQSAMLSSARLTVQQSSDGPTYLYQVNATQSLRYLITDAGFSLDTAWTRDYRSVDSGSTQASSPLLYGKIGQIAFADNTAPGASTPINFYMQPLAVDELPAELEGRPAFDVSLPGYNFFMIAGDPFQRQLMVYYDPINRLLAAHQFFADGSSSLLWERNDVYTVSASPAIVSDRDLLYIDNYKDGRDYFVVLRLSTGEELASVPLAAKLPTIGTIFVGMNQDVFILNSEAGGENGLISRITLA